MSGVKLQTVSQRQMQLLRRGYMIGYAIVDAIGISITSMSFAIWAATCVTAHVVKKITSTSAKASRRVDLSAS